MCQVTAMQQDIAHRDVKLVLVSIADTNKTRPVAFRGLGWQIVHVVLLYEESIHIWRNAVCTS